MRVSITWAENGAPAEDVAVRVVPWGARHPLLETKRGVSDARGVVQIDDVPAGRTALTGDRGGRAVVQVVAGELARAELAVPAGVDVDGLVTDPTGVPLARASIWLSEPRDHAEGAFRAVTGADGRFRLRSVGRVCWVGARADGYAPTTLRAVGGQPGERVVLTLTMPGPGGGVRGLVRGPSGAPVEGATVLIGVPPEGGFTRQNGVPTTPAAGVTVVTDAHGTFHAEGFAPGPQPVLVRTPCFAPHEQTVVVDAGGCALVTATLASGAVLAGTVRDGAGRPIGNARVGIGEDLSFFAFTRTRASFLGAFTHTAADGSYRLTGLPAGAVGAWAKTREGDRVEREPFLLPDTAVRWDPQLGHPAIAGRVVDENGQPLAGWRIDAHPDAEPCDADLPATDADGGFVVERARTAVERIDVREPASMRVCARLQPLPPTGALLVRVPDDARPSAFVVGAMHAPGGQRIAGVLVHATRPGEKRVPGVEPAPDGRFRVGPLPPGDYVVAVETPGGAPQRIAVPRLVRGEVREIGPIALGPPAGGTPFSASPIEPGRD